MSLDYLHTPVVPALLPDLILFDTLIGIKSATFMARLAHGVKQPTDNVHDSFELV